MSNTRYPSFKVSTGILFIILLGIVLTAVLSKRETKTYAFQGRSYAEIDSDDRHLNLTATDLAKVEWRSELLSLIDIVNTCTNNGQNADRTLCQSANVIIYGAIWKLDQDKTVVDCELALKLLDLLDSDISVTTCTEIETAFSRIYATGTSETLGALITRVLERRCYESVDSLEELRESIIVGCS